MDHKVYERSCMHVVCHLGVISRTSMTHMYGRPTRYWLSDSDLLCALQVGALDYYSPSLTLHWHFREIYAHQP